MSVCATVRGYVCAQTSSLFCVMNETASYVAAESFAPIRTLCNDAILGEVGVGISGIS